MAVFAFRPPRLGSSPFASRPSTTPAPCWTGQARVAALDRGVRFVYVHLDDALERVVGGDERCQLVRWLIDGWVFASVGIREADAEELRTALLAAAGNSEARLGVVNSYGQRYIIDFELVRQGRTVRIRLALGPGRPCSPCWQRVVR